MVGGCVCRRTGGVVLFILLCKLFSLQTTRRHVCIGQGKAPAGELSVARVIS